MKAVKNILAVFLITYFLMEITGYLLVKTGVIASELPNFKFKYTLTQYPFQIADINEVWGTWHYKEPFKYKRSCLQFEYSINSDGARDKERTKEAPDSNRVIVLGDSFIEGFGVSAVNRLTNIMEDSTKKEFLNFACSDIGTTQEYMIYKTLGSQFSHSDVLLFILPFNDFSDNDTSFYKGNYYKRYRPYFTGKYPNYTMEYKYAFKEATYNKTGFFAKENSARGRIGRFLRSYTCWFNIVNNNFRFNAPGSEGGKGKLYSGYHDYTTSDMQRLCYIVGKIKETAGSRNLFVVSIPVANEIKRYEQEGSAPFSKAMDSFCRLKNIEYYDLLPLFAKQKENAKDLYFPCDAHWNEKGNKLAANILLPLFSFDEKIQGKAN